MTGKSISYSGRTLRMGEVLKRELLADDLLIRAE